MKLSSLLLDANCRESESLGYLRTLKKYASLVTSKFWRISEKARRSTSEIPGKFRDSMPIDPARLGVGDLDVGPVLGHLHPPSIPARPELVEGQPCLRAVLRGAKGRAVPFDCLPGQALRRAFDRPSTNGFFVDAEAKPARSTKAPLLIPLRQPKTRQDLEIDASVDRRGRATRLRRRPRAKL